MSDKPQTENCPKCDTKRDEFPGVGLFCPNPDRDVVDNILGESMPMSVSDQPQTTEEWRSRSDTVQRDPLRVKAIAEEVVAEIRRHDTGESDASVHIGRLDGGIYLWFEYNEFERSDLIRAAAPLIEYVALWDLDKEGAF